jgi:hypothetical protein
LNLVLCEGRLDTGRGGNYPKDDAECACPTQEKTEAAAAVMDPYIGKAA